MIASEPALLTQTAIEGVSMWSRRQPERGVYFNSFFVRGEENIIVDPLPLDDPDLEAIRAQGGAQWIVITNRDHQRDSAALAERLGAKIAAPALDAAEMSVTVDRHLREGESIGRARVLQLEGLKSPGEFALYLADCGTVIVGDALWGVPAGALRLMADEKLRDPKLAALSLRRLWALEPRNILVGDGTCIFGNASAAIAECLESRSDVLVNKINVDELPHWVERKGPGRLHRRQAEIGLLIGAQKLGYQLFDIEPGKWATPMHAHTEEEELYIILEGSGTIRFPRGEYPVRKGDFIALPASERAAHQLKNDGTERMLVLALSNVAPGDGCIYTDSDKLLFARGTMSRLVSGNGGKNLDYWDGETG